MEIKEFELFDSEDSLQAIFLDNGEVLFRASEVCLYSECVKNPGNISRWVKANLNKTWYTEFKTDDSLGRPGLYITLPGFLYTVATGKTEASILFRSKVFEEIIPKIIKDGYYLDEESLQKSPEKIEKLESELSSLKEKVARLEQENKKRILEALKERSDRMEAEKRAKTAEEQARETEIKAMIESYAMDIAADLYANCEYCNPKIESQFIEVSEVSKSCLQDLGLDKARKALDTAIDYFMYTLQNDGVPIPSIRPKCYIYYIDDQLGDRLMVQGIRRSGSYKTGKQIGQRLQKFRSANGMKPF